MKVVHILSRVSRLAGGLFETVPGLTKAVSEASEVQVSVVGTADPYFQEDSSRWSCKVTAVPLAKGFPRRIHYAPGMLREVLASDASLAVCHGLWTHHNWVALRWAEITARPYLISPHGMVDPVDLHKSRLPKWVARRLFVDRLFRRAACVRAICESEARSLRAFGVKVPICLIPNGIWLPQTKPSQKPEFLEQVPSGKRVLFYLGRLNPKKGLPALLSAWGEIQKRSPKLASEWVLAIGGWDQNGHLRELRSQAGALGLERTTIFPGPLFGTEKHSAYSHAAGFIIPSTSEGMPTAVLEAWAYRLPVLMTPECNLPEGFARDAAIPIDTNPESITRGLCTFMTMNHSERAEIGERGLQLVKTSFAWPELARKLLAVYDWILGAAPCPACVRLN